jgi:Contractile injection system tube protein/LysM domain
MTNLGGPRKAAMLVNNQDNDTLEFDYNPTSLTITKTSEWQPQKAKGSKEAPPPEFVGTNARSLAMTVMFDALEDDEHPVIVYVDKLLKWTCPTKDSFDKNKPQPPLLYLQWGGTNYLLGYLKSVTVRYTLFSFDGTPLRASVDITIEETPEGAKAQNPTSGGVAGRRSVGLGAGDSVASLARKAYGDPNLWRALAVANGIDDPMRIPMGTTLLVPPLAEARALARPATDGAGRG